MQVPSATVMKLFTRRGALFVIEDGEFISGGKKHTFVVCNGGSPEEVVILCVATSQYQKVYEFVERVKFPLETVVSVSRGEYDHFPQITVFDCNTVWRVPIAKLIELHSQKKVRVVDGVMKPNHMAQIEAGICASSEVVEEIKDLVRSNKH